MATYYRWRKSTINRTIDSSTPVYSFSSYDGGPIIYTLHSSQATVTDSGEIELHDPLNTYIDNDERPHGLTNQYHMIAENGNDYNAVGKPCYLSSGAVVFNNNGTANVQSGELFQCKVVTGPGTPQGYVYSTSSSAYPNGGVSGSYYYDQRTTVTSPTAPTGLTYPNPITTSSVSLSWTAATSATSYPVNRYEVSYSTNGTSWAVAGTTASTSYSFSVTPGTTSITFRVRARDTNGQWGGYMTGTASQVLLAPTLTVPQMVMQGQQATISWSAIEGADSYTLQRKSSADADWTQVYSGANLSYSETVGTWTSVQYRVQAVFDGTSGGWAESAAIPVVSSSALVISGTDGDLGTVVNDIPYSISTDTGNQITATITVNSAVIFSGNVGNSTSDTIPVLDLVNGTGTIVIEASVTASGGPVSAVRTWTYTKTLITFPNAGSVAQLTKEGENIFPKTLAECVRLPGGKTLDEVTAFPCQVYAGSYVGTGTYGQSNPNTLTFPFEPKVVFIGDATSSPSNLYYGTYIPLIQGVKTAISQIVTNGGKDILYVSWDGNTVSYYSNGGTDFVKSQLNATGVTYNYVAIG